MSLPNVWSPNTQCPVSVNLVQYNWGIQPDTHLAMQTCTWIIKYTMKSYSISFQQPAPTTEYDWTVGSQPPSSEKKL